MKYFLLTSICACLFISCSNSFINHNLTYEKVGDCAGISGAINMTSNINGERYEFYSCIDEGFDGKSYSVERKGDSMIVKFPKTGATIKAGYKFILDIDAKPAYRYIILDGRELQMVQAQK